MTLSGALPAAVALLLALAGCDSSGSAGSDSAIRIAAVGDMNGVRTTDPSSESGRNGAAIAAALEARTVDAFLGLGDFQYDIARCEDYVEYWNTLWGGTKS